ncbi:hypothetical protein Tcan_01936 [Toxocara canis]|uniref:CCHC-type domain-containing protein n=1 Tax=Toxocara canis TaxID=6265 RepID=A0A0B2VCP9_TOXCA|nr:hypothetical protein Tcan_01936 [Toxocara canis]
MNRHRIADVTKLTHLLATLQGKAKAALEGLPVTNASYAEAVDILHRRFGDINVVRRALYVQIQNLPRCDKGIDSVGRLTQSLDKICRQLRALGEDPDHPAIILSVQQKLSPQVLEEITRSKVSKEQWTLGSLQQALESYIRIKEEVASILNAEDIGSREISRRPTPTGIQTHFMASNAQNRDPRTRKCELCSGSHFADECVHYLRIADRRERLSEVRRCFRCLREGHQSRRCDYNRPCLFCRGNHHQALCPKVEEANMSWNLHRRSGNEVNVRSTEANSRRQLMPNAIPNTFQPEWMSREARSFPRFDRASRDGGGFARIGDRTMVAANRSMEESRSSTELASNGSHSRDGHHVSFGANVENATNENITPEMTYASLLEVEKRQEEVYLMTANVKLYKPDAKENKGIPATVLFDSGSQRTFVSEDVVRSLELTLCLRQVLSLNTFASRRARAVDSEVVELQVALRDGSKKTIQANTVPYLTKELKCRTGCTNGKYGERGDPTEQQVVPDLLIGADYLWEFLDGIGIEKLPDVSIRIPTTVGDLYSGRISTGDLKNSGHGCRASPVEATRDTFEKQAKETQTPRNPEKFWSLESVVIKDSAPMRMKRTCKRKVKMRKRTRKKKKVDEEVLLIGRYDIKEPDDENKKLQFVYDKLNHELRKKVELDEMKICRHDDILIRTIRWIGERDAVEAARQLLGREDIQSAAKIGDALGIRCSNRKPEELTLKEPRERDEDIVFSASKITEERRNEIVLRQLGLVGR